MDACIAKAIDHELTFEEENIEVGAVIASPGFEIFDARLRGEYGYGEYKNVVSSIQFERILSLPVLSSVMYREFPTVKSPRKSRIFSV